MQNHQTVQITFTVDELEHLMKVLNNHIYQIAPFTDFRATSAFLFGQLKYHLEILQPGGVGRSPVQPSGAVDQVTTSGLETLSVLHIPDGYSFVVGD